MPEPRLIFEYLDPAAPHGVCKALSIEVNESGETMLSIVDEHGLPASTRLPHDLLVPLLYALRTERRMTVLAEIAAAKAIPVHREKAA